MPMQTAATTFHPQVWEGDGVVKSARKLIGATNPLEAEAGTIRGDQFKLAEMLFMAVIAQRMV